MREGIAAQFRFYHFARPGGREASFFDLQNVRQSFDGRLLNNPFAHHDSPSARMLKKSASISSARRAHLARQARSEVQYSKFKVQSSENLELRTSNPRPSRSSRLSRAASCGISP